MGLTRNCRQMDYKLNSEDWFDTTEENQYMFSSRLVNSSSRLGIQKWLYECQQSRCFEFTKQTKIYKNRGTVHLAVHIREYGMRAKKFLVFEHMECWSNENNIICLFFHFSDICWILDPVNCNFPGAPRRQRKGMDANGAVSPNLVLITPNMWNQNQVA